jgi:N-acetylglucosamine malate deacetylase 1
MLLLKKCVELHFSIRRPIELLLTTSKSQLPIEYLLLTSLCLISHYLSAMKLDLLAFGSHPDDVELGCSGTIIKEIKRGKKVGIIDLTQGELGTRGTIETRYQEAASAAMIMGISVRENLKLRDGFFQNNEEAQLKVVHVLRKYRPEIVIANILEDRHPDHGKGGWLLYDACFLSGLRQVKTIDENGTEQEKWKPKMLLHYIQDRFYEPDVILDVTDVWEQRMNAIRAYKTQFYDPESKEPQSYLSNPEFMEALSARARLLGKRVGVKYGEGFVSKKNIGIKDLDCLLLNET